MSSVIDQGLSTGGMLSLG